ncbi:hypothetical protein Tco_0307303 [Tanacetum coccineum]
MDPLCAEGHHRSPIAGTLPRGSVKKQKFGETSQFPAKKSQVNGPDVDLEEENSRDTNSNPYPQRNPFAFIATEQVQKLNLMLKSLEFVPQSSNTKFIGSKEDDVEIMRRKLNLREDANGGIRNFTCRIKGMHVFVGNFTYVIDFMIVEDISSILDPKLLQMVLGTPFIEISNMTYDPPEGVVRFIRGTDEVAYKMPHKIEQYDSLPDLEKEHTKSVYLRNEER